MIKELMEAEKRQLLKGLPEYCDIDAAQKYALAYLRDAQKKYMEQEDAPEKRSMAALLFPISEHAVDLLLSAGHVDIAVRMRGAEQTEAVPARIVQFIPLIVSAGAAVILFTQNKIFYALVGGAALLGSAAQTFGGRKKARTAVEDVYGEARIGTHAMLNALDYICIAMDAALEKMPRPAQRSEVVWSGDAFMAAQMFWEALHTQDGDYALKGVPSLLHALEGENIRIVEYSEADAGYFEKIPGEKGGMTIRPALLAADGRILAQGQVTSNG